MTGLNIDFDLIQVMGRMVLINLVLYFSPTPGGSGIAEAGFVMLFANLLPGGLEGIFAVLLEKMHLRSRLKTKIPMFMVSDSCWSMVF